MHFSSPVLLEVNTRVWLQELSTAAGQPIGLSEVPDSALDEWQTLGFTHIWLMGVWQIGPAARAVALQQWREKWRAEFPESGEENVHGSPYAIAEYSVDTRLGYPIDLLLLKERLGRRGLRLILDFVPNHLGIDSTEPRRYPARFVQAAQPVPGTFHCATRNGERFLAHGRDPFFPPWVDTVQVDYRVAEAHDAMSATAQTISMFGDGLRCDMAMLLLPDIFEATWRDFPCVGNHQTDANFWRATLPRIRQLQPSVDLIAEAYWDREQDLQDAGFDYTYNKRVTDYLVRDQLSELVDFLYSRPLGYLKRSVHFLENHDEARIASILSFSRHRAAAALILFLPGMALFHAGQLEGRQQRTPIQLNCRPDENNDALVERFYRDLFAAVRDSHIRKSRPELVSIGDGLVAVRWLARNGESDLAIVNLHPAPKMSLLPSRSASVRYQTAAQEPVVIGPQAQMLVPAECALIVRFGPQETFTPVDSAPSISP